MTWPASPASRDANGVITVNVTDMPGGHTTLIQLGDPVTITGCADSTFNTGGQSLGAPSLVGTDPYNWQTDPNALVIKYNNGSTGVGTTTGCIYGNMQGYVNNLTASHNTIVTDQGWGIYNGQSCGTWPWMEARNLTFKDDMILNSIGFTACYGEGTRTETKSSDPTTLTFRSLFMGDRGGISGPGCSGAACYTEYSDAHVATTPPTTIYLTPASPCRSNDPVTGNCAGVLGAMSIGTFPTVLPDWHSYRLCHSGDAACNGNASLFSAGAANAATDGTDLGVNPSQIDAAQTSTRYCNPNCGIGSFPDLP
jgi:hypothetical protein